MRYMDTDIIDRFYQNVKIYGFKRTLKKLRLRVFHGNSNAIPQIPDFEDNGINLHPNVETFLQKAFPNNYSEFLEEAHEWYYNWKRWVKEVTPEAPVDWDAGEGLSIFLYVSVRILRPPLVVETGTANGTSSAAISAALHANDFGKLETFDVYEFNLEYVPDYLRNRITSHVLNKRGGLESWLTENEEIISGESIFFHDSNHSFEHQSWEYEIAKNRGFGYMISDDVDDSFAFIKIQRLQKIAFIDGHKIVGFCKLIA